MLAAATIAPMLSAEERHSIESRYYLEVGGGSVLDTYLSPMKYDGVSLGLSGEWSKNVAWAKNTRMQFNASLSGIIAQPPAKSSTLYQADMNFEWGLRRVWQVSPRFSWNVGGGIGTNLGVVYLPGNGNNPATAKADLNLFIATAGAYSFTLKKLPVTVRDQVRLPSLSMFFSQDYAEPYYEIYMGNHSGLVHPGWWGNNFAIDNLLSADMTFSKHTLTVGYRFRVRSSYINDINTQIVTHAFVVGLTY
jgi:hypothetical protein